jgi:hypothetical protein
VGAVGEPVDGEGLRGVAEGWGIVVSEDAEGAEGRVEAVEESVHDFDADVFAGFVEDVVSGEDGEVDSDGGDLADESVVPSAGPPDVQVGEVGDAQALEGEGQLGQGQFGGVDQPVSEGHGGLPLVGAGGAALSWPGW